MSASSRSSSMTSRLWSRASLLGRDSLRFGSALAHQLPPILRRQAAVGDSFRNVLVEQARQSNQVAHSLLSWQQQYGLLRYHGLIGYWRQRQLGLLQTNTGASNASSSGTGDASVGTHVTGNSNGNVVQVAFMITAAMRTQLTKELGYTADQIKSMTPTEASLILFHKVKPEKKKEELPALLEAFQAEQERQHQEQLEQENQRQLEEAHRQKEMEAVEKEDETSEPPHQTGQQEQKQQQDLQLGPPASSQPEPNEGVASQIDQSQSLFSKRENEAQLDSNSSSVHPTESKHQPLGSFVASMEEEVDKEEKEWWQVVEIRNEDQSEASIGLFDNLEEAEMALDLKRTFAERRAKEDNNNKENKPVTTYRIQKTVIK